MQDKMKASLCMCGALFFTILGIVLAIARPPNSLFWLSLSVLVLGIGALLLVLTPFFAYQDGLKTGQAQKKIVAQVLEEYVDLLNLRGENSEEAKTFRNRFQNNPELCKLLDAAKMVKSIYSTLRQGS